MHKGNNRDIYQKKGIRLPREILYTKLGIFFSLVFSFFTAFDIWSILLRAWGSGNFWKVAEQVVFITIIAALVYGNVLYQWTRMGYLKRLVHHPRC